MASEGRALAPGDLLTVQQALALLPIGKTTLYGLIDRGELPAFRIPGVGTRGRILLRRQDIEDFVQRLSGQAPRPPAPRLDIEAIHRRVRREQASA